MNCTSQMFSMGIFMWITLNILKSIKATKLKSHKQNVLNEMNVLTFEWVKKHKACWSSDRTEKQKIKRNKISSSHKYTFGCMYSKFRKFPKKWPWHSPFWLDLSFYVCWRSSEIRWGLSHSSSLPWWSLTSQTSDTFSQKSTRGIFYHTG